MLFSLVLVATSCTAISVSSPSGSRGASPSHSAPTTSPEVAADRLIIGARSRTDGWVVMADGFGVHVAGGGTLQNPDLETGQSSEVAHIGSWDYDFSRLGRYGEGSLWLASGHDLWDIAGSPQYVISQQYDLHRLGYLSGILQASPAAGGGTWVGATGDGRPGGLIAELDPDSGSIIRRFIVRGGPGAITEADGFIIVTTGSGILRLNPRTGRATTKHLGVFPQGIAATRDRVWWVGSGDVINCLLMPELTDCGTVEVPRASILSGDARRLWVLSQTGSRDPSIYLPDPSEPTTVTLVDGLTGDIIAGPVAIHHHTPASLTSFNGHAWVGFHDDEEVVRIDRTSTNGWARPGVTGSSGPSERTATRLPIGVGRNARASVDTCCDQPTALAMSLSICRLANDAKLGSPEGSKRSTARTSAM